jgi:hypothetical protein
MVNKRNIGKKSSRRHIEKNLHTPNNKQQKELKQDMNGKKLKKKQVEEEEMLVKAFRIEVH